MFASSVKKNKIVLSDYNFKRDIENRLLMAQLSVFEVAILHELVNHSLNIPLAHLIENLETSKKELVPVLNKLIPTKLFVIQGDCICVDKEMRKYYESQLLKFEEDFEPGIDYLQGLLNKVPIHVLPSWYAIPKACDHIFSSILEKCLISPKVYEAYLAELEFDHPVMRDIVKEVFSSPEFSVPSHLLKDKYGLTPEQFEEYMLLLEFNFACCLTYRRNGDVWEEMVTPFYEWKEYLEFQKNAQPKPIQDSSKIQKSKPLASNSVSLDSQVSDRDVRAVKKCLKRVVNQGWIYFEDFLKGMTASIGKTESIILKNKGKRWKYTIPDYSEKEYQLVESIILERLHEEGVIAVGVHQGKRCFCVTPYGQLALS